MVRGYHKRLGAVGAPAALTPFAVIVIVSDGVEWFFKKSEQKNLKKNS